MKFIPFDRSRYNKYVISCQTMVKPEKVAANIYFFMQNIFFCLQVD